MSGLAAVLAGRRDPPARDLGALADALTRVRHERGTVALWEGWSPFARADPRRFAAVVEVLTRRCTSAGGGAFVVLLRGDGPAVGLPDLDPLGRGR